MKRARTNTEILEYVNQNGAITERDILNLKNRANAGDREAVGISEEIATLEPVVTAEQAAKGFAWLWNLYITPAGRERKNNPFGYREIEVLEDWTGFSFDGFYNAGRYRAHYVPLYTLFGKGGSFQYYVWGGEIQIVG
jgi:hypothetical protein